MTQRQTVIDPSVLTELGKMYTTISQTLRELVQNGFDAYANNVYIDINIIENYITVKDDGVGMNDYVILNHYSNVGMSTKKKELSEFPKIPPNLNSKRPKIGKKGMGKLSWILVAKSQETITTSIDIPYSIKVNFNANNLQEYDEPSHINKHTQHGTTVTFKDLQINDIKQEDLNEFLNTTGFLHNAFKEFNIYLTINSQSTQIKNQHIVKILAEGYQFNTKGTYDYSETKSVDGERKILRKENIPYDFMFRLPAADAKGKSEFWLLSGYMGIKKLRHFEGFSGYLNIDNIELVANRNDIQTGEQDKYSEIENVVIDYLTTQLEKMYLSNRTKEVDIIVYLDGNQKEIINLIYNSNDSSIHAQKIAKHFTFDFYGQGFRRLSYYLNRENAIYYYEYSQKTTADKASYYGYKCFSTSGWIEQYIIKHAFDSSFIQPLSELPKEAYETAGTTIKPTGNLSEILSNMGKIFDSLSYAYSKVTSKAEDLKRELAERADSLTDLEKKEKQKELEDLIKKQNEVQNQLSTGSEEEGETEDFNNEPYIKEKKKHFKSEKKKAFKQSKEHYLSMKFANYNMKIGFAYFDDNKVIANIYMQHFIHLNLNNEYIKSATKEKNPFKQLILLTPHMCHEVAHLWSSEHDEVFQMAYNMLLVPALDHLLKQIDTSQLQIETQYKPSHKKIIRKKIIPISKTEEKIDKTFDNITKKADDILLKILEDEK